MQKTQKIQAARKLRVSLTKATGLILLGLGAVFLVFSIFYASQILAFIGLGLIFWGVILTYIQNEEYIKQDLLDTTTLPLLATLNQILQELDYRGKAIYLPPKYLKDPETTKAYIPKQKDAKLPAPEQIQEQENKTFPKNPEAALIIPPGFALSKLFEKTLGTTFTKVDLEHLQQNLPKTFIHDLEIAENLEIQTKPSKAAKELTDSVSLIHSKNDTIHVKIANSIYKDICKEARQLSYICGAIGCPICSAIACAITKATGKPVIIEKEQTSEDGRNIHTEYHILEEPKEEKKNNRKSHQDF